MPTASGLEHGARAGAVLFLGVAVVLAAGCGSGRTPARAPRDSASLPARGTARPADRPDQPPVPFGGAPCQSLSSAEESRLGMRDPVGATPGRAPDTLPLDNLCTYSHGGRPYVRVGYQTMVEYDLSNSYRSTSHRAPTDLPGAFYDRQDGLWFSLHGYYVVVTGEPRFREPVARAIAGKL